MSPKNDLQSVVSDPSWLPSHWDGQANALQFVHLPRERHAELTFLADEYLEPVDLPKATFAIADLLSAARPQSPAPYFIFHSAFCCSTLLARAFDIPGAAMALKEPQILNELAGAAQRQQLAGDLFALVLNLLARPFAEGERLIIKPSNVVNLLAPALMNANAQSRAVFLYAPLPRFLGSVAAKGLWGRRWARRLFLQLRRDTGIEFGLSDAEQFELSDVQVTALASLMHHAQGADLLRQFPGRVLTLDSEVLLARRVETIAAAAAQFRLGLDQDQSRDIADGPVFATHSKAIGRAFDPEEPLRPKATVPVVDEEIAMVTQWARAVGEHAGISRDFPSASVLVD